MSLVGMQPPQEHARARESSCLAHWSAKNAPSLSKSAPHRQEKRGPIRWELSRPNKKAAAGSRFFALRRKSAARVPHGPRKRSPSLGPCMKLITIFGSPSACDYRTLFLKIATRRALGDIGERNWKKIWLQLWEKSSWLSYKRIAGMEALVSDLWNYFVW